MRILLLEDEPLVGINLQQLIARLEPDAEINGPLASVRETNAWQQENEIPDLILADIQLSDGISFLALEHFPRHVPIIFTTAFDQFALRAFRLNSIDYLLKPVDESELKRALEKFHLLQSKFNDTAFTDQLHSLLKGNRNITNYKQRFMVFSGRSVVPVTTETIAWFVKDEIIFMNDRDGHQFVTEYRSLDELQELLDPQQFYRANRRFLINIHSIKRFETDDQNKIHIHLNIENHPEISVSKDKAADFKKWIDGI